MRTIPFTVAFCLLFLTIKGFEVDTKSINVNLQATKLFCIQDLHTSNQSAFFQHKLTKTMYRTFDGTSVVSKGMFPSITYKKMECIGNQKIAILTQNNSIYLFNTVSQTIQSFNGSMVSDGTYMKVSQNKQKIVYISNFSQVRIQNLPFQSPEEIYPLNGTFSSIICSTYRNKSLDGYCFLLAEDRTKIQYFNASSPLKIQEKEMPAVKVLKISEMNQKIYLGYESGQIKEYSLKEGLMFYERSTKISKDFAILDLAINEMRKQLIYLNSQLKVGIISLASGYQIGSSMSCQQYCTNLSKIVLFGQNQFSFFTASQTKTIRLFLNNDAIVVNSSSVFSQNPLKPSCPNDQLYFNQTLKKCTICQTGCSVCDQQTAYCFECIEGYFMKDSRCLNCKYSDLDEEDYEFCLEQNEINVLSLSNSVAPVLVSGIQSIYSILSGSALLFLFIRFINFWSVISMYYFLNIETMPYFLLQFLSKIYTILYGSVFEYFGIDISSLNMGIEEKETNQKMKIAQISTDFVKSNFQSIVTFIYSTFLICVVYNAIKQCLQKFKIHVFEKVKLEACLEEFMGIFIPLVVPLSYFLTNLTATNTLNALNNALFIFFLGVGVIFPFIYLTLIVQRITLKQRLNMIKNEIQENLLTSQKLLAAPTEEVVNQCHGSNKQIQKVQTKPKAKSSRRQAFRIKQTASPKFPNFFQKPIMNFISQEEGQKFLYCLNAFWCSFLVGFSSPIYFLAFGLGVNFICVCNAFYAQHWRINLIIEKLILFSYHLCFVIMTIFPGTKFTTSLIAIFLIICGGLHELMTAIAQKIYFLFLVLKNKKILRDNRIAQELSKSQKQIFDIVELAEHLEQEKENQNSESESGVSIQVPTIKEIDVKTSSIINTKKSIKKAKFVEQNNSIRTGVHKKIISAFCFDKMSSIQSINLEKQTQVIKSHKKVMFQDVTNTQEIEDCKRFPSQTSQCNILTKNLNQGKSFKLSNQSQFEQQFLENQCSGLQKKTLSSKDKQNFGSQNQYSTNPSENYVSKSLVNLQSKSLKSTRFLKVISTKSIENLKRHQIISIKTLQKQPSQIYQQSENKQKFENKSK